LSYGVERRVSKEPDRFGKGAIEGVAGPESANNASAVSAFVPLLTLGIPTNAVMALLMAALMIRGVLPGPLLINKNPDVFWGTVSSMYVGNLMLLVLNLPLIGLWVRLVKTPYAYLYPCIVLFCVMGAFTNSNTIFDIYVMMAFGVLGFFMKLLDYEPAPLILAFVLGPLFEDNLRRTLITSEGSFSVFLDRPIALSMLVAAAVIVMLGLLPRRKETAVPQTLSGA
jgi:putative tricarboxylic transport membrane protein